MFNRVRHLRGRWKTAAILSATLALGGGAAGAVFGASEAPQREATSPGERTAAIEETIAGERPIRAGTLSMGAKISTVKGDRTLWEYQLADGRPEIYIRDEASRVDMWGDGCGVRAPFKEFRSCGAGGVRGEPVLIDGIAPAGAAEVRTSLTSGAEIVTAISPGRWLAELPIPVGPTPPTVEEFRLYDDSGTLMAKSVPEIENFTIEQVYGTTPAPPAGVP